MAPVGETLVTVGDYADVFSRRRVAMAMCVALTGVLALLFSMLQTPKFTAATEVLVRPPLVGLTEEAKRVDASVNMHTEVEVASSESVADLASQRLGDGVGPRDLLRRVTVTEIPDSNMLRFTVAHSDPEAAATIANEFAQSYLDWRVASTEASSTAALERVQQEIVKLEAEVAAADAIIAQSPEDSNASRTAQTDRKIVAGNLTTLRRQVTLAGQFVTSPGEIIDPATTPESPASPVLRTNLLTGLAFGALIGVFVALFLDRADPRLVHGDDSLDLLGMRVLGTIAPPRGTSIVNHGGEAAEAHRRLTGNVLFLADSMGAKVLLITSPDLGDSTPSIAGEIAASAARVGRKVMIVSASLRSSNLDKMFSVEFSPGLVGVLIGDSDLEDAIRTNPRFPNLDVLLAGRPVAQPTELLQTPAFRFFVKEQRENYDLVIIEAPAVNTYADALAVAPVVDGVVLMIEDGRSTRAGLDLAKGQLERNGASIVGTVHIATNERSFLKR